MPGFGSVAWTGTVENLVASAARTTSGDTGPQAGYGPAQTLRVQLNVTAAAGTSPTLDVVVEDSIDGGSTWNAVGTFTQATGPARQVINVTTPFSDTLRVRWTVGGTTPSFTFAVHWIAQA